MVLTDLEEMKYSHDLAGVEITAEDAEYALRLMAEKRVKYSRALSEVLTGIRQCIAESVDD